jgi:hypothetical protein
LARNRSLSAIGGTESAPVGLGTVDDASPADDVVGAVPVESPVETAVLGSDPALPLPLPQPASDRAARQAATTPSDP